jgi:predicted nucleic acid-binding protein
MRRIFADTLYWVAITSPKDQWHQAARKVSQSLSGCELVTTEEVLTEFVTAFSAAGPMIRQQAVDVVRDLYTDPSVTISRKPARAFNLA